MRCCAGDEGLAPAARGPGGHGVEVERVEPVDAELGQLLDAVYRRRRGNACQRLGESRRARS
jgi:hypothetical protein